MGNCPSKPPTGGKLTEGEYEPDLVFCTTDLRACGLWRELRSQSRGAPVFVGFFLLFEGFPFTGDFELAWICWFGELNPCVLEGANGKPHPSTKLPTGGKLIQSSTKIRVPLFPPCLGAV